MDLSDLSNDYIQQVASYRNNIPHKSLNYKTPLEIFMKYITKKLSLFVLSEFVGLTIDSTYSAKFDLIT